MNDTDFTALSRKARKHLARRDPRMKTITDHVGACTLVPGPGGFDVLVRSIVAQLISTAAARTIYARIEALVGEAGVTPEAILAMTEEKLRAVGLSGGKTASIRDLAARISDGRLPLDELPGLGDSEAISKLTAVRGIGVWTAEMYLIFGLGRTDVLPVGDLGLRDGVRVLYELDALPNKALLTELGEPWRPYRSIATWYFWRSRGAVPKSE